MSDQVTANLPAIDLSTTEAFYSALGFETEYKSDVWMILQRGPLVIEFFPYPDLDPYASSFGACVRVGDVDGLYRDWARASLQTKGIPRLEAPADMPWGLRAGHLVDTNGSLLRMIGPLSKDLP